MTNEDDFVEKLLKDLPKAPPMNDLEIRKFNKHVDSLVAAERKKEFSRGWSPRFSIAASVIALVAGVAIFADSSKIINPENDQEIVTAAPTAAPNSNSGEGGSSGSSPDATQENGNDNPVSPDNGTTVYGNGDSPEPSVTEGSIPVLNFGFDYEIDEIAARSKVSSKASRGSTKLMKSSQIACSVKLGIDEELYALDKGTYAGEDIEAYYFGASKNSLDIKVVGFGCEIVRELTE
jgi:hypothetical protein